MPLETAKPARAEAARKREAKIEAKRAEGKSNRQIAREVGVHHTTLGRSGGAKGNSFVSHHPGTTVIQAPGGAPKSLAWQDEAAEPGKPRWVRDLDELVRELDKAMPGPGPADTSQRRDITGKRDAIAEAGLSKSTAHRYEELAGPAGGAVFRIIPTQSASFRLRSQPLAPILAAW